MGGGGTQTTSNAEYPPEFRPLATAAVAQIKELMGINPLNQYAVPNPGLTAGLSPYQVSTMQAIPGLNDVARPIQGLQQIATPVSQIAQQAGRHGDQTHAERGALWSLSKYAPGMDLSQNATPAFNVTDLPWADVQRNAFAMGLPGFPSPADMGHYSNMSISPQGQIVTTPATNPAPFQQPQGWGGSWF